MKKTTTILLILISLLGYGQDNLKEYFNKLDLENKKSIKNSRFEKRYLKGGDLYELQYILNDTTPIYYQTTNVTASKSTRANILNNNLNLNGQGITYNVWDGGHGLSTHQELTGRITIEDGLAIPNFHATHVAGTIISKGINTLSKGMASLGRIRSYDWNSDIVEATQEAQDGMIISNHSYGYNPSTLPTYFFGGYITVSRNWDLLMYDQPYYLMCVAAGNDGMTTYNTAPMLAGYDKLSGHATSKNNLVVASAEDANIDSEGNLISVTISDFSSQGATDDLRIKPDLAGNGRGLYSTDSGANNSYRILSGTSMATPNVVGTLGLIQERAKNVYGGFVRAATLKGLALHTADDAGALGVDVNFGWGLLNAKKAVEAINNGRVNEMSLSQGQTYTTTVSSDNINDLKVSISWTDPAGIATTNLNDLTPKLVNDLDVRVIKNGQTYYPWSLTSVITNSNTLDNFRDPFERVDISQASGDYTVVVSHKGALTNSSQKYTLIITGIVNNTICGNITTPNGVYSENITETSARINWNVVDGATYEIKYKKTTETIWTTITTTTANKIFNGLSFGTQYEVQVKSICGGTQSAFSQSLQFTTLILCNAATPTNVITTNVTGIFATINWTNINYTDYVVRYRPVGSTIWQEVTANTNSKLLFSLQPSTQYEAQVKSFCLSGSNSQFSNSVYFTTLVACQVTPPTNIVVSNITESTATVTWNAVTGASTYKVRWQVAGSVNYYLSQTSLTTSSISQMISGTTYEIMLQTVCESGALSEWSPKITIVAGSNGGGTTCVATTPTSLNVSNLTGFSTNLSWAGSVGNTFTVKYKESTNTLWITVNTTNTSLSIGNLTPLTQYNVEVVGKCTNGLISSPSILNFTTLSSCVAVTPTNLYVSSNTAYWSAVSEATYQVEYTKTKGKPSWTSISTNINSAVLSNILAGQTYKVRVRSLCGSSVSAWSSTVTFTATQSNYIEDIVYLEKDRIIINFPYKEIKIYNLLGQLLSETEYITLKTKTIIIVKIDDKTFKLMTNEL